MTEVLGLVSHPVGARVSVALLHFLWQGTLVAGLGVLLLAALRRSSASTRYGVLLAVFAAMALCPVVTLAVSGGASSPVTPEPAFAKAGAPGEHGAPATISPDNEAPLVDGGMAAAAAAPREHTAPPAGARWSGRGEWLRPALPWVGVLWLAGVVVLSLRLLVRWWAVWRLGKDLRPAEPQWQEVLGSLCRRLATSRPIRLMMSTAAQVPMVIGWLRPAIVMPASALTGLTPEQITALLAHELAHIRRHDQWVSLAQMLVELLLFYHPAVWWISRAIRAEREHCCDDAAVGHSGDLAGYMRALTWVEEHRGARVTPAVAATGSPLVQRVRRLAGYPAPTEMRLAWLAALTALAMATLIPLAGTVSGAAADEEGHQPGLREQWQPETGNDPRLQQPVEIEIIGRAAEPALVMLSEQTGVTLAVAPDDLGTVGERKLTVLAQGCSLKAILVQIPKALQECHWDIDPTGPEPVYLLHRNGGAETTMAQLAEKELWDWQEEGRPAREARVAAARKALGMSPAELAELEKTDLYLARSVIDAKSRSMLELFLSLPEVQMNQFIDTGTAAMPHPAAPEHFRKAADQLLQASREEWTAKQESWSRGLTLKILDVVQGDIDHATIQYEDDSEGGSYLRIFAFDEEGSRCSWGVEPALWSRHPRLALESWYRPLLLGSGTPEEKAADALAQEWERRGATEKQAQTEMERGAKWREPRSPELHREIMLPFEEPVEQVEVQRFIAEKTGLSLVSDHFTTWGPRPIPEEARASMPAWRLLYLLGEKWFWTYDWNEAGTCLVFSDRNWYRRVPEECPESLVIRYREKLAEQGTLTLEDVAAFAVDLERRRPTNANVRRTRVMIPRDLARAGLSAAGSFREGLLMYAALTPEQRAKARSAEGLPYAKMTGTQQEVVRRSAVGSYGGPPHRHLLVRPVPEEEIVQAVYRITDSRMTLGEPGPGDLVPAGTYDKISLALQFPNREVVSGVALRSPQSSAAGSQQ